MTFNLRRILVPIDFSSNSAQALDYARGIAFEFGASLHLVHVCEVPTMMLGSMDAYAIAYSVWSQQLGEEAEKQLAAMSATLGSTKTTTEVLFGPPAAAIVEAAQTNKADLIVMGTHGHGAVMHMVVGNVAERVVRTAPCPVLTVREPRPAAHKAPTAEASWRAAAMAFLLVTGMILAPGLTAIAGAQEAYTQSTPGAEIFRTYCASCHGTSARGDGPLASAMNRKPANLTEIAKRNGGVFPTEMVFRTIDGRQPTKGHGGPDMPVWGDAFAKSREAGDTERVKTVIQSLVDFLEKIQLRPSHEQ